MNGITACSMIIMCMTNMRLASLVYVGRLSGRVGSGSGSSMFLFVHGHRTHYDVENLLEGAEDTLLLSEPFESDGGNCVVMKKL